MGVEGRDLGHIADDVNADRRRPSARRMQDGGWTPVRSGLLRLEKVPIKGTRRSSSAASTTRMQDTFRIIWGSA